jgi:hypothetical protein
MPASAAVAPDARPTPAGARIAAAAFVREDARTADARLRDHAPSAAVVRGHPRRPTDTTRGTMMVDPKSAKRATGPRRRPATRRRLLGLLVSLAVGGALAGQAVRAEATEGVVGRPCATRAADGAAAAAMASRCGQRVEALSGRTPYAQVFANADGTMTLEQTAVPRWARRADGAWTDVDTTLRFTAGGAVAPVASVLPMTLSGGGTGPLVRLSDGGRQIALSWPHALPRPVLDGATAVYRDVLPDVDLRVTASALGFSQVLEVKTRAAAANPALREIRFGLTGTGVTAAPTAGGGAEARDAGGRPVFASPAPTMWDAAAADASAAPAPGPSSDGGGGAATGRAAPLRGRRAVIPMRVEADRLTVVPDAAMLADPRTRFPVRIDPDWTGGLSGNAYTSVWSKHPTSSFWQNPTALNNWQTKGGLGAGYTQDDDGTNHVIRSIFRMDTTRVLNTTVLSATFIIKQEWAWVCSSSYPAKLWLTGDIGPSTTWNNQPTWTANAALTSTTPANQKFGGGPGCGPPADIRLDATAMVRHAVSGSSPIVNLGLRAVSESVHEYWKRFNHTNPRLSVVFNTQPNVPDQRTVDGRACGISGGTWPFVATASPTLRVRASDPDSDQSLRVNFTYAKYDAALNAFVDVGSASQSNVPNGATAQFTPTGLVHEGLYSFRAQSDDGQAGGLSPTTPGQCEFQVDLRDPDPPEVESDLYPAGCSGSGCGSVGMTGRFTFSSSSDVASYLWGFSDPPTTPASPAWIGGPVTVSWTPDSGGAKTLHVTAVDRAGRGKTSTHQFVVAGPSPAVASWRLNDPAGSSTLEDETGNGRPAALTGGGIGAPGRVLGGDTALSMNGATWAEAPTPIDTSRSFSVSAWVRLTDDSSSRVAVSVAAPYYGSFYLMYHRDHNRWAVSTPVAPNPPTAWKEAYSAGPPRLGVWTHLAGVYDSASGQLRMYVDGQLTGTATGVAIWSGPGPLQIGQVKGGGSRWVGDLAQVRVWNRVISAAEVAASTDPPSVGEWHLEEEGPGPAFDSSPMDRQLTFAGGAHVPLSGAGKVGMGLRLDGTGQAYTDGPVLNTDQSFTVSAWVRLRNPTWNHAAVSQDGATTSSFHLGYNRDCQCWAFSKANDDIVNPHLVIAAAPGPAPVEVWTHLTGVHDASAATITLYVNGVAATTVPMTSGRWPATGSLVIGRARSNGNATDFWTGDVDEVHVYQGARHPAPGGGGSGSLAFAATADAAPAEAARGGAAPAEAARGETARAAAGPRDVVVSFEVTGLPAGARNVRASLELYSLEAHRARVSAHRITAGSGPPGPALASALSVERGYNPFDVSTAVAGNGSYTFVVAVPASGARVPWAARDHANPLIRPRLVITFETPTGQPVLAQVR